jgi:hypothetical protein
MGEIFAGLGIVDDEVSFSPHHFGEVLKRHIGAGVGIVEPAVGVFLDDDRPALLVRVPCHVSLLHRLGALTQDYSMPQLRNQ